MAPKESRFYNPYVAGVLLGLVLLGAFLIMGRGLGASGGVYRFGVAAVDTVATGHVTANEYMSGATSVGHPLDSYFVFMVVGVFLGGLVSAYSARRLGIKVIRGPQISVAARLGLAFGGGIIMGIAARFARGCTSGQALSGGALLSAGSWIFMLAVFAGGYAFARLLRRQWL